MEKKIEVVVNKEEGVVIVAVLWICALIMWFALQISTETRLQGEEQVHRLRQSQALHLAIGGCYEALARMGQQSASGLEGGSFDKQKRGFGSEDSDNKWLPNGRPHVVEYSTGQALVIVEDEAMKVNVNTARPDQLKAVLQKAGIEEADAEGLADVIIDFRDPDDVVSLHGAEKDQYKQKGLPYGPFNGPLLSVDQLLLIPGISQQLFYGYGAQSDDSGEDESEVPRVPMMPGKRSLFQVLSVYGTNQKVLDDETEDALNALKEKIVTWKSGGIYRILSCGKPLAGSQTAIVWLIVRFVPESENGYEVLYRKVL
jgi:hypothetical protein